MYEKDAIHLDKIVYKTLPDAAAEAGDIQMLDTVSATELPLFARKPPCTWSRGRARLEWSCDQHQEQERRRKAAVRERGHAALVESEAATGVRGGDRSRDARQGGLRRSDAAELHADSA